MSRSHSKKPDTEEYVFDPVPDFMAAKTKEQPDKQKPKFRYLVERAKYIGQFGTKGDADFLATLIRGEEAHSADEIAEIYEIIDAFYPKESLKFGEKVATASPAACVRARFLALALGRILELNRFPKTLRNDLSVLLSAFPIQISESRARAQRELEDDEVAFYQTIADRAQVDRNDLYQWRRAGIVIDPREGRRPSGPPR